jgi:hypothetical protein
MASRTGRTLLGTSAVFFGICLLPLCLRRQDRRVLVAVIALVAIATAIACGSGNAGGSGGGGGGGGFTTPAGTYSGITLSVAVGGIPQFVYVNVNVQ